MKPKMNSAHFGVTPVKNCRMTSGRTAAMRIRPHAAAVRADRVPAGAKASKRYGTMEMMTRATPHTNTAVPMMGTIGATDASPTVAPVTHCQLMHVKVADGGY